MLLKMALEDYLESRIPILTLEVREEMLKQIGNPDSYLRDNLIYKSFVKLIFSSQLQLSEIEKLLETLIGEDFLFYKIGESGDDSVFKRSFSVLVIAAIIENDVKKRELDFDRIHKTVNMVTCYMRKEKDVRGFIENKGWAHAVAHGADALDALAKHNRLKEEYINQILNSINHSLCTTVDYLNEEEERLAAIIVSLINCQNAEQKVILWLLELKIQVKILLDDCPVSLEAYHIQRNVKNFLKSLYVMLNSQQRAVNANEYVFKILEKWMHLIK